MTLLSNYYGDVKGNALQIRMNTHFRHIGLNIILVIIGILNPSLSIYSILGMIFSQ